VSADSGQTPAANPTGDAPTSDTASGGGGAVAPLGRLKRRQQFLTVAGAKRSWGMPGLVLQARAHDQRQAPDAGEPAIRIGFTASKKVGSAVERNRARRRLRAAVAEILPREAAAGYDLVVIARQGTLKRDFAALKDDLRAALKRLGAQRRRGSGA